MKSFLVKNGSGPGSSTYYVCAENRERAIELLSSKTLCKIEHLWAEELYNDRELIRLVGSKQG